MKIPTRYLSAWLLGILLTAPALGQAQDPATVQDGILVNAQGMTLYTYDKDAQGQSSCIGGCAENWPPLTAPADAMGEGGWSLVNRTDGMLQWAYHGKPLYTFVQDKKPGDRLGDGKMSVWHVAKPQ